MIGDLDIEYKAACDCSSYITKERVLTFSQNVCYTCKKDIKRVFTNQPKYIIYSNAANQLVRS